MTPKKKTYDKFHKYLAAVVFYALSQTGIAIASDCTDASSTQCLNHLKTPLPNCHYDWSQQKCLDGAPDPSSCQSHNDKTSCQNSGCFFDKHLGTCFASLSEVNSIFNCDYWTSYIDPDAGNQACSFHGCAYDSSSHTCSAITQEGSNQQLDTTTVYSSSVFFSNENVPDGSATFNFDISFPRNFVDQDYITPRHPILQILNPTANVKQYSEVPDGNCSSFQVSQYMIPAAFSSPIRVTALPSQIQTYQSFHGYSDMNWNDTSMIDYSQDVVVPGVSVESGNGSPVNGQFSTMTDNTNVDPGQFVDVSVNTAFGFTLPSFYQIHRLRVWYIMDANGNGAPFTIRGWPENGGQAEIFRVTDTADFLTAQQKPGLNYADCYIRGLYDSDYIAMQFINSNDIRVVSVQIFGKPSSATTRTIIRSPANPTAIASDDVIARMLGVPKVGPNELIKSWYFDIDSNNFIFHASIDLPTAFRNCALRGVTHSKTSNGEQYVIPVSYVESTVNGLYAQSVKTYTINILTTGQITLGATTQFHEKGFPIAISYPQTDCGENQARMQIEYRYEIHDVYEADQIIGPRSASDISVVSDPQINGPISCYNEVVSNFEFKGCEYNNTFTCAYQYSTQTECRDLNSNGDAFNYCQYSPTYATGYLGGPYPSNYDSVHRAAVNNYICPSSTTDKTQCVKLDQNAGGYPSQVVAKIVSSNYLAESKNFNPFRVSCGFLPTPTSALGLINTLTNTDTSGTVKMFDGNLFSSQAMSTVCKLPNDLLDMYQLRILIKPGNTTFNPLDQFGRVLGSQDYSGVYQDVPSSTSGYFLSRFQSQTGTASDYSDFTMTPSSYSGRTLFDINEIKNNMLYTTKNFYNQGCGPNGQCFKLPATAQKIGADGWSIPVSQLEALVRANGYQWNIGYQVELVDVNGLPFSSNSPQMIAPSVDNTYIVNHTESAYSDAQINDTHTSRSLLQTSINQATTVRSSSKSYFVGTLHFQISVDANNTITLLPVGSKGPSTNSTSNQQVDFNVYISNFLDFGANSAVHQSFMRSAFVFYIIDSLAVFVTFSLMWWFFKKEYAKQAS